MGTTHLKIFLYYVRNHIRKWRKTNLWGGIVKDLVIPQYPYAVEYFKGGFKLKSTVSNSFLRFNTTQQEVIGTIYETPELLEDKWQQTTNG